MKTKLLNPEAKIMNPSKPGRCTTTSCTLMQGKQMGGHIPEAQRMYTLHPATYCMYYSPLLQPSLAFQPKLKQKQTKNNGRSASYIIREKYQG